MPPLKSKPTDAVEALEPLTPARAVLAGAIEKLRDCQERFDRALEPLGEMERVRAASLATEGAELRAAIDRLHASHAAEVAAWVAAGAAGNRPAIAVEVFEAERRLGQIGAEAAAAAVTIAIAEEGAQKAAENLSQAMRERDAAVWPATVEACRPIFEEMRQLSSTAIKLEARLRGLVKVLRDAGDRIRDQSARSPAFRAAELIERQIVEIRGSCCARLDRDPGRDLIERLRTDAAAPF
jgi:hypothetical protein